MPYNYFHLNIDYCLYMSVKVLDDIAFLQKQCIMFCFVFKAGRVGSGALNTWDELVPGLVGVTVS